MRFLIGLVLLIIVAILTKNKGEARNLWKKILMLIVLFVVVMFLATYLSV